MTNEEISDLERPSDFGLRVSGLQIIGLTTERFRRCDSLAISKSMNQRLSGAAKRKRPLQGRQIQAFLSLLLAASLQPPAAYAAEQTDPRPAGQGIAAEEKEGCTKNL